MDGIGTLGAEIGGGGVGTGSVGSNADGAGGDGARTVGLFSPNCFPPLLVPRHRESPLGGGSMAAARAVEGEVNGDGDDGGRAGGEEVDGGNEAGGRGWKMAEGAGRSRALAKSPSSPRRWLLCVWDRE